jgi:hypothetical protein
VPGRSASAALTRHEAATYKRYESVSRSALTSKMTETGSGRHRARRCRGRFRALTIPIRPRAGRVLVWGGTVPMARSPI